MGWTKTIRETLIKEDFYNLFFLQKIAPDTYLQKKGLRQAQTDNCFSNFTSGQSYTINKEEK